MKPIDVDPKTVGKFFKTWLDQSLVDSINSDGWQSIPPVPIYELPSELQGRHKYVLADGHHRRDATEELGIMLPCILYEPSEQVIMDGAKPATYDQCIKLYRLFYKL